MPLSKLTHPVLCKKIFLSVLLLEDPRYSFQIFDIAVILGILVFEPGNAWLTFLLTGNSIEVIYRGNL